MNIQSWLREADEDSWRTWATTSMTRGWQKARITSSELNSEVLGLRRDFLVMGSISISGNWLQATGTIFVSSEKWFLSSSFSWALEEPSNLASLSLWNELLIYPWISAKSVTTTSSCEHLWILLFKSFSKNKMAKRIYFIGVEQVR